MDLTTHYCGRTEGCIMNANHQGDCLTKNTHTPKEKK